MVVNVAILTAITRPNSEKKSQKWALGWIPGYLRIHLYMIFEIYLKWTFRKWLFSWKIWKIIYRVNIGPKMKVLKFLGIQPSYYKWVPLCITLNIQDLIVKFIIFFSVWPTGLHLNPRSIILELFQSVFQLRISDLVTVYFSLQQRQIYIRKKIVIFDRNG